MLVYPELSVLKDFWWNGRVIGNRILTVLFDLFFPTVICVFIHPYPIAEMVL